MPSRDLDRAADFSALSNQFQIDLAAARIWMNQRDKEMSRLLGVGAATNILRQELIIVCLEEFCRRVKWPLKHYQDEFAHLASRGTVRSEIYAIAERRLFVFQEFPADRRLTLVSPTLRLTNWASETIPKLKATLRGLVLTRGDMLPKG